MFYISTSCKQVQSPQKAELSLDAINSQITNLEQDLLDLKKQRKAKMQAQGIAYIEEEEILSSTASDSTVIIKGRIKTNLSNKIRISLDRPYRSDYARTFRIDKDGKFEKEISVKEPAIYKLKFGKLNTEIYLAPGNMLGLVIDTSANQTLTYIGDLSAENNHLFSSDAFNKSFKCPSPKSEEDFSKCINTILDSTETFAQANAQEEFSAQYKQLIHNNFLYSSLLGFIRDVDKQTLDTQIDQHIDLSKIKIQKPGAANLSLFSLHAYRKFIFEFFELSCKSIKQDSSIRDYEKYTKKYNKIESLFEDQNDREFMKTDVVFESIRKIKSSELNPLVLQLRNQITNEHYLKTIADHYKKNVYAGIGTLAPAIEGPSYTGGQINLEEYKGKYVYIFVWATWCGPCKMEIPFYEKLIADYSGSNIEFLGVAVDKDESKWLESFLFQKYPGTQMLVKGDWNSPMIKDFNLKSVPQFILLNPKGEIVTLEAPRPSKGASSYLNSFGA